MNVTRTHITAIVLIIVGVWLSLLAVQGLDVFRAEFFKPFGLVVSVVLVLATAFNKWAWKWRVFRGWLVVRPDISGTWESRLETSSYEQIKGFLIVRQTMLTLTIRFVTEESKSMSVSEQLYKEKDGRHKIAAVYLNEPAIRLQQTTSRIHHGAFLLEFDGFEPTSMKGHYWTDRKSLGEMTCQNRDDKIATDFECASQMLS